MESPEIDTHKYNQPIFGNVAKAHTQKKHTKEKVMFSTRSMGTTEHYMEKRINLVTYVAPTQKLNQNGP
jgi:hypothetical protein